jgi:hypothetical protein
MSKKKLALCLYGIYNHHFSDAGDRGYEHITERILSKVKGDYDIFFHSWEPDLEKKLRKLYNPTSCLLEPQIDFSPMVNQVDEKHFLYHWERDKNYLFRTFSFLHTRGEALRLCKEHSEKTGVYYDCVIACRFDLGQRDRDQQRQYYVSRINFDPSYDMSFMYSALYDQLNAGMADQWFYSSQENMMPFIHMRDRVREYLTPGSAYVIAATTGWPDSNYFKHPSPIDDRQFTNEVLKPAAAQSKRLAQYPRWDCVNNHLLHKWFLIEQGLYQKCKFLAG